jgi:hypothetical protein
MDIPLGTYSEIHSSATFTTKGFKGKQGLELKFFKNILRNISRYNIFTHSGGVFAFIVIEAMFRFYFERRESGILDNAYSNFVAIDIFFNQGFIREFESKVNSFDYFRRILADSESHS